MPRSQWSAPTCKKRLTGERRAWLALSLRLGTPLQQLQDSITSSEFTEYQQILLDEQERELRPTKLDYYLAQIALEAFRSNRVPSKKIKLEDFLLKFQTSEPPKPAAPVDIHAKMKKSKAAWAAFTGTTPPTKPRR